MLSINRGEPERFAVYAGDGLYVAEYKHETEGRRGDTLTTVRLDYAAKALDLPRNRAIELAHGARRAGVAAWIVPHPAGVAS